MRFNGDLLFRLGGDFVSVAHGALSIATIGYNDSAVQFFTHFFRSYSVILG